MYNVINNPFRTAKRTRGNVRGGGIVRNSCKKRQGCTIEFDKCGNMAVRYPLPINRRVGVVSATGNGKGPIIKGVALLDI